MENSDFEAQHWLKDEEVAKIYSSEFWNNEEYEKEKAWNVEANDFKKMEAHLTNLGVNDDLRTCFKIAKKKWGIDIAGIGIDLAAGNLWAVPYIMKFEQVKKLYCLELSRHRLLKLGPIVLRHYNVPKEKIVLVHGSFYDIKLPDQSLNFAILSAAFHHADEPLKLLREINRTLKVSGIVVIIGEISVTWLGQLSRYYAKYFISRLPEKIQRIFFKKVFPKQNFIPKFEDVFPVDNVLGDHLYPRSFYKKIAKHTGFDCTFVDTKHKKQLSLLLRKIDINGPKA